MLNRSWRNVTSPLNGFKQIGRDTEASEGRRFWDCILHEESLPDSPVFVTSGRDHLRRSTADMNLQIFLTESIRSDNSEHSADR